MAIAKVAKHKGKFFTQHEKDGWVDEAGKTVSIDSSMHPIEWFDSPEKALAAGFKGKFPGTGSGMK
jgi:hypothetical protein